MPFNYDFPIDKKVYANIRKVYDLFTTPLGKEVLDEMMETYEHRSSFVRNDPYATHFYEGQRSVILEIRRILNGIDKDLFIPAPEPEKEDGG